MKKARSLPKMIGKSFTSAFKKVGSERPQAQPADTLELQEGRQPMPLMFSHAVLERYGLQPNLNGSHSLGTRAAIQVLKDTVLYYPQDHAAHLKLIRIYKNLDRYSDCIKASRYALEQLPNSADIVLELLHCLMLVPNLQEAQRVAVEFDYLIPTALEDRNALKKLVSALAVSGEIRTLSRGQLKDFFLVPYLSKNITKTRDAAEALEDYCYPGLIELAKNYVTDQGGHFVLVHFDRLAQGGEKSNIELQIVDSHRRALTGELNYKEWLTSCPDYIAETYAELLQFDKQYWNEVLFGPGNTIKNSRLCLKPYSSEFVNTQNGRRITPNAPDEFDNRLFLFGTSDVYCTGVEDAHTLSSRLQDLLIQEQISKIFRVENCGIRGASTTDIIVNLLATKIEPNDVVVFVGTHRLDEDEVPGVEPQIIGFPRPHDLGEIFMDENHFNWRGTKFAAQEIYSRTRALGSFETTTSMVSPAGHDQSRTDAAKGAVELTKYLHYFRTATKTECGNLESYEEYLRENMVPCEGSIGSVAVNCNPITLGHLHLIEYAAKSVDQVYLFVIEEDRSFFSFTDRLNLVTESVAHLKNVKVLKGGRFICTELTYPEYYTKETENDAKADASEEASYFCEYIAPVLGIKTAFLGNEPHCIITRQYNDKMAEILPTYGIKLDVIERISIGDKIVSASHVRKLLGEKDFDGIQQIVPQPVYDYLVHTYMCR